jgi:hypothetical protein
MSAVDPRLVFLHRAHARLLLVEANEMSIAEAVRIAIKGECKMTTEQKQYDNSGILFRCSDDKQKPNDRDFRGEITITGVSYWLSGWIKEGQKGKFLSLAIKPKSDEQPPEAKPADEIPF